MQRFAALLGARVKSSSAWLEGRAASSSPPCFDSLMFSVLSTWIFKQFHFIIDLFISFKDVWSYFIRQAKSHLAKSTKSVTRVTPPMEIAACFPSHIAMKPITTALQKTLAKSGALWRRIMMKTLTSDGDTVVGVHLIVYKFILSSWLWGSCEESTSSH